MRRSASEIIRNLERRIARLERSASLNSKLIKAVRRKLPSGISATHLKGKSGNEEIHLSWNPNNVYSDYDMMDEDYDYMGDNDLSSDELRIAIENATKLIRKETWGSFEVKQDRRRSDMDKGLIVLNLVSTVRWQ